MNPKEIVDEIKIEINMGITVNNKPIKAEVEPSENSKDYLIRLIEEYGDDMFRRGTEHGKNIVKSGSETYID